MNKMIVIDFSNGENYEIPAIFVANVIAEYYCKKEDVVYTEELERAYNDNYLLTDWLSNNFDWSDISHIAKKVSGIKTCDYNKEWPNAKKEVV